MLAINTKMKGYVWLKDVNDEGEFKTFVEIRFVMDLMIITFYPKYVMCGNDIRFNGSYYTTKCSCTGYIERDIVNLIKENNIRVNSCKLLKEYTFEEHCNRWERVVNSMAVGAMTITTAEWQMGDRITDDACILYNRLISTFNKEMLTKRLLTVNLIEL